MVALCRDAKTGLRRTHVFPNSTLFPSTKCTCRGLWVSTMAKTPVMMSFTVRKCSPRYAHATARLFQFTFFASAATDFDSGSFAKSSSTLSILALVSWARASTSAAVRPLVGIGGSTAAFR